MTKIKKRTKTATIDELISTLSEFLFLLGEQKESYQSISDLRIAHHDLQRYQVMSNEFHVAIKLILNSFEEDQSLKSLLSLHKKTKKSTSWSEEDQLFLLGSQVVSLANRLV